MSGSLLTASDLAEHFGLTERRVMEYANQYGWPRIQIGRKFRWTAELVEQIERTHMVTPESVAPVDGRTSRSAARRRSA